MIYVLPTDTCFWIACAFDDKKSYEKIYKIKKRNSLKPLAIMVEDFSWLETHSTLTPEQIDFLKQYEKPFTILTNSDPIELYLNFQDEHEDYYFNKDIYSEIAVRIANNPIEKKLIKGVWPIWLTSANISDTGENYNIEEIEEEFEYYIEKGVTQILWAKTILDEDVPASDVFRFIDDSLELEYVRKN